ncbi:MAG: hypothetical protein KAV00_00070, partial [Phycisphaerae bacterium]|nr:hypothetical protein [Phycisphaerae bacterium]
GLLEDCIAYDVRARGLAFDGVSNYTIRRYAAWNNGLWGGPRKDVVDIDFYRSNNNYVIDSDIERRLRNCDNSFGNSMINTRYGELYVTHGDVTVYYYLDVLVQDRKGKPISGAKVTVVNEVDAARTPINLHTKTISTRKMKGELLKPRAIKETRTGHDGHTPLPSDGENTLVIAEHLNKKIGWPPVITHYTYTIRAEKGGVSAKVTGIKPDKTWYRPKPDIPIKTIKITLRR